MLVLIFIPLPIPWSYSELTVVALLHFGLSMPTYVTVSQACKINETN